MRRYGIRALLDDYYCDRCVGSDKDGLWYCSLQAGFFLLLNLLVLILCVRGLLPGTASELGRVHWLVPKILGVGLLALFAVLVKRYYAADGRIDDIASRYAGFTLSQRRMVKRRMGIYRVMSFLLLVVAMAWLTRS